MNSQHSPLAKNMCLIYNKMKLMFGGWFKVDRAILLADMNSFFASVHQALDPELRGKPVIVAGDPEKRHGIVLTASYEAKKKGVKTGFV
jgi:hypothetical protein